MCIRKDNVYSCHILYLSLSAVLFHSSRIFEYCSEQKFHFKNFSIYFTASRQSEPVLFKAFFFVIKLQVQMFDEYWSIEGVKINNKWSFKNSLNCRFCAENIHEIQEHLQECSGTLYERWNLVLDDSDCAPFLEKNDS